MSFFSFERKKKLVAGCVRQVAVLYNNDCMGIYLGELNTGRLRRVVSYRGGRLNRFDCT